MTAYKLAVLEISRNLFVLAYIACPCYPLHTESTDSMIKIAKYTYKFYRVHVTLAC